MGCRQSRPLCRRQPGDRARPPEFRTRRTDEDEVVRPDVVRPRRRFWTVHGSATLCRGCFRGRGRPAAVGGRSAHSGCAAWPARGFPDLLREHDVPDRAFRTIREHRAGQAHRLAAATRTATPPAAEGHRFAPLPRAHRSRRSTLVRVSISRSCSASRFLSFVLCASMARIRPGLPAGFAVGSGHPDRRLLLPIV